MYFVSGIYIYIQYFELLDDSVYERKMCTCVATYIFIAYIVTT